ncbi:MULTISPECIES: SDR family oxidoreductase [unclassified Kaistella]|uniref:SDR family oxidoreductase n=1 Tax=unclassified Kaistella TaxID=2762626 RepID=UPI0027374B10|nr:MULTISPECIES: SDR family oxidoreductase [unclassified Kaistella]MDP2453339.1 SDR family oxidoreductase [Kaistella sp. SH11-4b]MDP2456396.1 SDR family oxidoreductase [Kaistella sp. SH40-3]MDP2459152.1 SDR family oxidoreductase [Kaistella sp. SH19-2b]
MKNYALITGSADRIGKAVAIHLAKQGYNLVLHYNSSKEKAQKVKDDIESGYSGLKVELLQINFLKENDFNQIFQDLKKKKITIEILVNCASDFIKSNFKEEGSELLDKEMTINFKIPYLLTKAFAKVYGKGNIINFVDTKVTKNSTVHLDYILSKKLLKDFTRISAVELAPDIRVNGIGPGLILPPEGEDESYLMNLAQNIPLKTIGNLEEILKAVQFILDSKFFTGQILYIDGGEHLV